MNQVRWGPRTAVNITLDQTQFKSNVFPDTNEALQQGYNIVGKDTKSKTGVKKE